MTIFELSALLLVLAAAAAYINHRLLRLPTVIGVMVISLVAGLILIATDTAGLGVRERAEHIIQLVDFEAALMQGMLGLLLFAGALHVNLGDLRRHWLPITTLATLGVLASTLLVGTAAYWVLQAFDLHVRYITALLFGALITPTDPIAVLAMLKRAGVPKSLEVKIAGESLFNDGIGVVVFLALLHFAPGAESHGNDAGLVAYIAELLLVEVLGGLLLGLVSGWFVYRLLRGVDSYPVEILLTVALGAGLYALTFNVGIFGFHTSGPLAVVVAGLLIGNTGREFGMSEKTREHLDTFWELIDEILNVVLFVLIGLEVLVLDFTGRYLLAGLAMVPLVLLGRLLSVSGSALLLRPIHKLSRGAVPILTWAGLRGGISVALALALPKDLLPHPDNEIFEPRDVLIAMTYAVVVFSIIVQGLTVPSVVRRTLRSELF